MIRRRLVRPWNHSGSRLGTRFQRRLGDLVKGRRRSLETYPLLAVPGLLKCHPCPEDALADALRRGCMAPFIRYNRAMALANGLIHPENTALVVVDLQEKLTPAISGIDGVLANTKKLLHLAKILPLKTLVTTQYRKGLGDTVSEIAQLFETEPIDKICFGCLGDDIFDRQLNAALPDGGTVVLCGIEAHICVNQTALGALAKGYDVHVVADAVGSRTAENRQIGIQRMRDAGAVVSSTEMTIYELLGDSRRPEFKQMLPYLKQAAGKSDGP